LIESERILEHLLRRRYCQVGFGFCCADSAMPSRHDFVSNISHENKARFTSPKSTLFGAEVAVYSPRSGVVYPQDEVEIWCADEARFSLQPVLRRVWAPRGACPVARVAPDYEWLWLYSGGPSQQSGAYCWLSLPRLDSEIVQLFLAEFAQVHVPEGKQVMLYWDGAPAHRAKGLQVPPRVTLVQGLPYTPELHPAENLWPRVKEGIANDCFKDIGALERRFCRRVRRIGEARELLAARLNYDWWPSG
jgi:hypothetical protein